MQWLLGIAAKIAIKAMPRAAPYLLFYVQNRTAIKAAIDVAIGLADKFRRDFPAVPAHEAPDQDDVLEAMAASSAGKTSGPLAIKKVREWTPEEWQIFWNRDSGGG